MLETVECTTGDPVTGSVIWLHGLGADGHDFEPIVPELRAGGLNLRFVFPHAPVRPVTINGGIPMRAWFDIATLERDFELDEEGARESVEATRALIRRENERGIASERIVLAGFSQGGAVALFTGLSHTEPLAGILGLSTFLPQHAFDKFREELANQRTPIFLAHGSLDPLVPQALGEASRDLLIGHGHDVEWNSYPMAHAVCPQEILDVRDWLSRALT